MADATDKKLPRIPIERNKRGEITLETYKLALEMAQGYKSLAAQILGVTPSAVSKRISRNKSLKQLADSLCDDRDTNQIDVAEGKIMSALQDGKAWAIRYVLDNKGGHRGFSRKLTIDGNISNEADPLAGFKKMDPETRERLSREAAKALLAGEDR